MKRFLNDSLNRWTLICYGLILAIFLTSVLAMPGTSAAYSTAVTGTSDGAVARIGVFFGNVTTSLRINTANDNENDPSSYNDNVAYYVLYASNTRDSKRTQVAMDYCVKVRISKAADVFLKPGTMYWYSAKQTFNSSGATIDKILEMSGKTEAEAGSDNTVLSVNPTVNTSDPDYNVYVYYSNKTNMNFRFNVRIDPYTHYMAIAFTSTQTSNEIETADISVSVIATQVD